MKSFALHYPVLCKQESNKNLIRGCEVRRGAAVESLEFEEVRQLWLLHLEDGTDLEARSVFNCAGNYSDEVHKMAGEGGGGGFEIRPARGESNIRI